MTHLTPNTGLSLRARLSAPLMALLLLGCPQSADSTPDGTATGASTGSGVDTSTSTSAGTSAGTSTSADTSSGQGSETGAEGTETGGTETGSSGTESETEGEEPVDPASSPFGIFGPYEFFLDGMPPGITRETVNERLLELGVSWVQEMPFNLQDLPSELYAYSRVGREGGYNGPGGDLNAYAAALSTYIAQNKDRATIFEVDTEPSGFAPPMGWLGFEAEYVELLKVSHETIKGECPECTVVLGGFSGIGPTPVTGQHIDFLRDILDLGAAAYFDGFSYKQHHFAAHDYVELKTKFEVYEGILAEYGVDLREIPVFVETAAYSGAPYYPPAHPLSFIDLPEQSEEEQAAALVKIFAYAIAAGVDRVYWNLVYERHNFGGLETNPFNYYGLFDNPLNDGDSAPKVAFFTMQRLIERLDGSDWSTIETLEDNAGVVLLKLSKNGRPIWIAWDDSPGMNDVVIPDVDGTVQMTVMVPTVDPPDSASFTVEMLEPEGGQLTVSLGESPVIIEG